MENVRHRLEKFRSTQSADGHYDQDTAKEVDRSERARTVAENRCKYFVEGVRSEEVTDGSSRSTPGLFEPASSLLSDYHLLVLKSLLWLALFWLFIWGGFGTPFLILSAFFFVYKSMSRGSRKGDQVSAYSVFNKDFQRLDGTLTADQFDKEIRFQN